MKAYTCLSALVLCALPRMSPADDLPIVFSRAGQKATVPVGGDRGATVKAVALAAFGRQWGEAATVRGGAAEFLAPEVRVPVVFRLTPPDRREAVLGELVVYPDRPVSWQKDLQVASAGAPDWFDGWSEAVGLPVKRFKTFEAAEAGNWPPVGKSALLILGRKTCGDGPLEICRLAVRRKVNVLVLEADWFGKRVTADRGFAVTPKQMGGALADWQDQQWALPPRFYRQDLAWSGVANRETWIASADYPLVEEIRCVNEEAESLRFVLSYLPWQKQLGRCQLADELFLRVLAESAKGAAMRRPLDGRWQLLYPAVKNVHAYERPVLAAAIGAAVPVEDDAHTRGATQDAAIRAYVLDLRDNNPPPDDLFKWPKIKALERRAGATAPLLILGDHALLDGWKWLKLDRGHHRSEQPGVLWRPDRLLPFSQEDQLRLMQQFTQWNVFLGEVPRGGTR
jgi:hypothetical protein